MLSRIVGGCLSALAIFALGGATLRCSSERPEFATPEDAGPPAPLVPTTPDASGDAPSPAPEDCAGSEIKQIFALARNPDAIYRFDPEALTFTLLGYLDCPISGAYSMAIDRRGIAWILLGSGAMLVNVRLDTLQCTEVLLNSVTSQPPRMFGMGFAADNSPAHESLFLIDSLDASLYRVDRTTRDTTRIGATSLPGIAELTGTDDGQLYSYATENGVIAHLDKTTGASIKSYRTSVVDQGELAFAQWGGDFWLFTGARSSGGIMVDNVTRFSPATGESTEVLSNTGIHVLGAGSSTCAPSKPVQ
jgi:hypothetical protein